MSTNKKHSPLKNKPLRNPGQSLDEKILDTFYDEVYTYIILSIFVIIITAIQWSEWYFKTPPQPILWTIIVLLVIGYCVKKVVAAFGKLRNYRLGRDGEKIVGQGLEQIREMGYKVIHDIVDKDSRFNIDHILIGPAGIFTVETKTYSKSGGVQNIESDGVTIKIDGFVDRNIISQAKSESHWLQDYILESTGMKLSVKPVVIFPGWFIEPLPRDTGIWILNEKALPAFLRNANMTLDEEKINLISAQIEKYNRDTSRTR